MPKKKTVRRRVRKNPVAANPPRRRKATTTKRTVRRVRRNPAKASSAAYRAGYEKTFGTSRSRTRKAAARKAAKTRAANRAKRAAAARKAARTRARNRRLSAKTTTRKTRTFKPRRHKGRVVATMKAKYTPRSRRRVTHKVRRTVGHLTDRGGKRRRFYRYTVSRNPATNMKNMLVDGASLYGGFVGAKIVSGLLDQYVFANPSIAPTMTSLGMARNLVSPAISFFLSAFAGKAIKNPKVVSSLQTGATLALLQAVVKTVVPASALTGLPPAVSGALMGIDDMGYGEYIQQRQPMGAYVREAMAMGEYIQQRQALGVNVEEAMALDEYIQSPGGMGGFDVQEALADSEVQGMQSGYAAGSLAKTSLSSF